MEDKKYTAAQKLWKIVNERDTYYYEIHLAGVTIDRIKIEEPAYSYLKKAGLISGYSTTLAS